MSAFRAGSAVGVLVCLSILGAAVSPAQEPTPEATPAPSPSPLSSPSPVPARLIRESMQRIIKQKEDERDPCAAARAEGKPCFPVTTEVEGWRISVRESLGIPLEDGPSPNRPPTTKEMGPYRPGPETPIMNFVSFDPICSTRRLLKALNGKNDTYYLYRVRDGRGERVEMYDHRLDPATFQGDLAFVGRFTGECAAIQAYRHEVRKGAP